jgi:hypothetical protein
MKMRIAWAVVCLIVMIGFYACGGGGSSNTPNSGTIRYYTVGESGTNSSPWGDASSSQRPAMAVKFTPTSYPLTITSITIYPRNNTGFDQMFNLYGFSELSTETEIFSSVQNQIIPDTGTSYIGKTINIPATTISSGSFYIAVEWVTKPLASASGTNSFFIRTDSHLDYTNTSYCRFTGTTWSSLESISATAGDLGIFVNYGSNVTNVKPVIVSANPSNGSTGVSRNIQEIEIQFSKEMALGISVTGEVNWPLSNSTPTRWSADHKTFFISRDNANSFLPAGVEIHITFNDSGHPLNFMDIFSNTLDSYTLSFTIGQ